MKTPQQIDTLFTVIAGGFASTVAYLIGGVDNLSNALTVFMILDYFTGIMSAFYMRQLNSYLAYRGLAKKAGMIAFVIVANQLDIITGNTEGFLRDAMMMFLIGMEGISIKENVEKMGFDAPGFIVEALKKLTGNDKNDPSKED